MVTETVMRTYGTPLDIILRPVDAPALQILPKALIDRIADRNLLAFVS